MAVAYHRSHYVRAIKSRFVLVQFLATAVGFTLSVLAAFHIYWASTGSTGSGVGPFALAAAWGQP